MNNFFFIGIIQNFKILRIVFTPKKLIKGNYKPSKMKVLKYTFQQSFKPHNYWEFMGKKTKNQQQQNARTNAHIFACTHKCKYAYTIMQAYTHAHIDTIIYTQTYPYTHRLKRIYFS